MQALTREGLLPCKYVVADSLYGQSPDFLDALDACVGVTALVGIPAETRCGRQRPQTTDQTYRYQGEVRSKRIVVAPVQAACSVGTLAASLPAARWYRRQVSEGTKGPIVYEFARQRVTLCKHGLPERTVWLVIKRTIGVEKTYYDSISNAPASTPLRTLVWLSSLRWAVEQCVEEGKTELGLDHYEGRKYAGWHHHILLTMLAHLFLWHLKIRLGEKSSSTHSGPTPEIAGGHLPPTPGDGGGCTRRRGLGPTA